MVAKLAGLGGSAVWSSVQNPDINVTPLVDVMLVLLIIFMVAAPLATVAIKVDVPPYVPSLETTPEPVVVRIASATEVFVNDVATSRASVAGSIARLVGGNNPTGREIMIRSEHGVAYAEFIGVLNDLEEGGFHKIGLVAEPT